MMALSPPLPSPDSAPLNPNSLDLNNSVARSVTPAVPAAQLTESDARHEPLKLSFADKLDSASTAPTLGTPLDPDSIPIDPPKGTPPPELGHLFPDVLKAEQNTNGIHSPTSPLTPTDTPVDMASNADVEAMLVDEPLALSDATVVNGVNGHSNFDDNPQLVKSDPTSAVVDTPMSVKESTPSVHDREEDGDEQLPPAKRVRRMSGDEPEQINDASLMSASPAAQAPPSSVNSPASTPPITMISVAQHRFSLSTIRTLKKLKDASPFLVPVDFIALNISHYPTVIKQPMDLGTVERKLLASHPTKPDADSSKPRYLSVDDFVRDVKLIFRNCVTFNGAEHAISQMGARLESVFDKQLKQMPPNDDPRPVVKAAPPSQPLPSTPVTAAPTAPAPLKKAVTAPKPQARRSSTSMPTIRRSDSDHPGRPKREIHPPAPKDLPYADAPRKVRRTKGRKDDGTQDQLKFCGKILGDFHRKQYWDIASPFYEPVDYVKLEIPSCPKIIKKPMDLATMKRKLDSAEYSTAQKFYDDFKLMIRNCFTFNPEGTLVNQAGVELQKVFDDKWASLPPLREMISDGEEEEEEEESDDEQARYVAAMETQIEILRGNVEAMKKKPKKEKKEKRKDKHSTSGAGTTGKGHGSKPYNPSKSSKKGKKGGDDDVLSFEQKKDLSETIAQLDGPKLERVIQIIHEGVPEIRDSTEEIELDIDSLPPTVLTKLYNFVLRPIRAPPKRSRGVGGGTGGLKRKSMDEDVEAERIRQLEQRIALFDGSKGNSGAVDQRVGHDSARSSDDSSDDSSGSDTE